MRGRIITLKLIKETGQLIAEVFLHDFQENVFHQEETRSVAGKLVGISRIMRGKGKGK